MNILVRILGVVVIMLLFAGVYAVASQPTREAAPIGRMPAPAANATDGNVQDLTQ